MREHYTGLSAWALSATTRVFRKGEGVNAAGRVTGEAEVGVTREGPQAEELRHFWKLKKARDRLLP